MAQANGTPRTLKRDLGTLEPYAILVGIMVGAGIFRVTSEATAATAATGPPVVLATCVAYLVFLPTP